MATLLMRPMDGAGSADKKRRARKGKNAQKKQPQRGLGVAQLEKLRLQEQSLLCPTQSSSSYSLRLCTPAEHSSLSSRCDSDIAQNVLSLTTINGRDTAGGGGGGGGAVSRLAMSGHSSTQSLSSIYGKCTNESTGGDAKRVASRALACINQSSKFSVANVPFFSNVMSTTSQELQVYDDQGCQSHDEDEQQQQQRRAGGGSGETTTNTSPVYIFSTIHNLNERTSGYVNDCSSGFKLHPVFKDVPRIPLTITEPHYLETLLDSDHVPHAPRKRIELPVVGATTNVDNAKELPSFQSHPSNPVWSSPDKASGRKRPWLAVHENGRQASQAQALDLNAPAGENESGQSHNDRHAHIDVVTQDLVSENRIGAHYTTGIVRSALGNSCLPLVKLKTCSSVSPWQDSDSPSSASGYFSDIALYPENGLLFKQCASPSIAKDSCSGGPTSYHTLNRKRCLNDPDTPSTVGKESICSSNFLTLGISSSSYPGDGWIEVEESTQDTLMSMNRDGNRLKQGSISGGEGDDGPQLRTSFCEQELGPLDLERNRSSRNCSTCQSDTVLSSVAPSSTMYGGHRPLDVARRSIRDEDILDLRLKLAL